MTAEIPLTGATILILVVFLALLWLQGYFAGKRKAFYEVLAMFQKHRALADIEAATTERYEKS